ncbi:alpha-mannosidase [Dysgonomonas sp. 521]|uniref:GH92 family glycosyl hydrolase n=1 Tax=Dysgonomonas sp. 521 TaxID=2302932 RepID=UPI0013D68C85|nr:GH92 family glycosyl hydrolase [Dysgonomonas sp. 521]NDV95355.1 alpha-mannosidase [Dysgonomonas sp. 521]
MKKILFSLAVIGLLTCCSDTPKNPIDYVDPFIGTGFHGHTYPGATVPNGAVQLSPDTRTGDWDACSGYHYSDTSILGFSHTHLSGTGCADLGDVLFHPTTKDIKPVAKGYIFEPLAFSHKDEKASPGYYSVEFKNEGIKAELTATTYTGVHRYTFEKGKNESIIIDMAHVLAEEVIDSLVIKQSGNNEISGMRRSQGWVTNQYVFFVAQFSKDIQSFDRVNDGIVLEKDAKAKSNNQQAILNFGASDGTPIVAKVGFSVVSEENARKNLSHDVEDFDFDMVHNQAKNLWAEALSDIIVEGGSENDLKNFYTAAYHSKVVPNIMNDVNGQFRRHDMKIGTLPEGKKYYSTFSIWDTFRAWNPLITLTDTTLVNNMINSYLDMYDASGELPIWPLSAGETGTMIGYHSVSVIADAYMKGIRGFDINKAYEAMKVSSDKNKKGSDYYIKYGFIPSNIKRESVSCLLEYAYDDWCIAQIAKELGKEDDYKLYTERASSYINVFDGNTKFFRGKRMDGNWDNPFNPFEPGRAYTEATAWQYRFFVPHDVNGLIQLFGGKEGFTAQLDSLFIVESKVEGHMSDITGLIGQYAHGNEPSHHMAYLYNYVGQPWKTQAMTRRILAEMYQPTPEGISGNEDCGQMSAWYILSSIGIYPVCPGSNEFSLTSPLFKKATIKLANGEILIITANNPQKNVYIDNVSFNGKEINVNYITYQDLMQGGELKFTLASTPNKNRGIAESDYPHSMSMGKTVSIPYTRSDLDLFVDNIDVDLHTVTEDAKIYYTLDGKEPTEESALYTQPVKLSSSTTIKARAYKTGFTPSRVFTIQATKAIFKNPVSAQAKENGTNFRYYEGYFSAVGQIEKTPVLDKGIMPEPSIAGAKQADHFAFTYTGIIFVPEDGIYEFMTMSDDGSVLYIDNIKIVDNDGSHAAISATGRIALKKGYHTYKLLYFEDYEGEHLSWGWKRPASNNFEKIPASNLFIK